MIRKAVLIRAKDKFIDTEYSPPLMIGRGVWSESVEMPQMTMSRVVIPPGARNRRHFHTHCDAGIHILKGRLKIFFGPDCDATEGLAEAGDFIFVPKGTIHGLMNLSDAEPAEIVSCCGNGVGHPKDAGTVYLEPPLDK